MPDRGTSAPLALLSRAFLALRALFFVALLPGTISVYVPLRMLERSWRARAADAPPWAWPGALLIAAGAAVLLASVWEFFSSGRGTLAPIDPPRALVVRGLYRFTRNPMYNGVTAMLLGESWLLHSTALLAYALFVAGAFHLFVLLYEEPTLADKFGTQYAAYRRAVPRWGFTLKPFRDS